jgi:hypothetical protein
MSQARFEPAIAASERLQTHALDRVATDRSKQGLGLFITNSTLLNPRVYKIPLIQYIHITVSKLSIRNAVCDTAHPVTHMRYQRISIFNLCTASFKAYCAIWVRRSNFHHQASPRVSPCESTQRWKVKLWAKNVPRILPKMPISTLHLGIFYMPYFTSFTSPPKEGYFRPKNPTA